MNAITECPKDHKGGRLYISLATLSEGEEERNTCQVPALP